MYRSGGSRAAVLTYRDTTVSMARHRLSGAVHKVLYAEERITACLEHTAKLERPWNLRGCREEPQHLHSVTSNPANQN